MQVAITMQTTIDTLQVWYPPLLLGDEDTVNVSTWQPIWKMSGIIMAQAENDRMDAAVAHIDSVLSNIHQVGIGYHDAVSVIAIPLIVAIFAFSFMFLFDAVNGINDKYKSSRISSLFENQASSKLIITISWVSISYVLIYGMVTLFFQDSDFWNEWAIFFDLAALIVSIVYACEVVSFAKCCMRFNKPSAVLELIDKGVKLKPRTLVALLFFLVGKLKNRRNLDRMRLYKQGVRLYVSFADFELKKEHVKRLSALLEYAMTHKDDSLIASILNSLKRFVDEENKFQMGDEETNVIRESYVHVFSNLFYDDLFKQISQHPQDSHVIDNIIDSYLNRFLHVRFVNEKDMVSIVKHIALCAECGNTLTLEKFIESSNRSFRFLKFLHIKTYVLGLSEEDKDDCISKECECWEKLCNHFFIAFAYAVYIGCYSLIPSLTRAVGMFGHNLFPCTKADVLYRYLHCRQALKDYAILSGSDCNEAFGRVIDIEPIIAQYASLLLATTKEDKMIAPFSSTDFGLLAAFSNEIKDGYETIRGNVDAIRYDYKTSGCDFNDMLGNVVAKVRSVKTETFDEKEGKREDGINWAFEAKSFLKRMNEKLIKFCIGNRTPPETNNYTMPVIQELASAFESLFCNNLHPFQNCFVSNMFGETYENKNDVIEIAPATFRIDKRFFLSETLYNKHKIQFYQDSLNTIRNRIMYAYLNVLENMESTTDEVCVSDVKTYLQEKTKGEYDKYALIHIDQKMLVNEDQTVVNIELDTHNYAFLDQLPSREQFNNTFILIEKDQIPYLFYRDEGKSTTVNFTDLSSEEDGILEMAMVVDYGLSLRYNKSAKIRIVKVKPLNIAL